MSDADRFVAEIPSGADQAPDVAVGQDAEEGVVAVRNEDESLVLFIHFPDRLQQGRIAPTRGIWAPPSMTSRTLDRSREPRLPPGWNL